MRLPSPLTSPPTLHKLCFPPPLHLCGLSLACVFLYKTLSHTHRWPHVGVNAQTECVFCDQRCYKSKCKCKQCGGIVLRLSFTFYLSSYPPIALKYRNIRKEHGVNLRLAIRGHCFSVAIETACPCSSVRHAESSRDKTWALRIQSIIRDKMEIEATQRLEDLKHL